MAGSAIAVTAIVLLVGMPEFHFADEPVDDARYDEAIRKLKEKQQAADSPDSQAVIVAESAPAGPPVQEPPAGAAGSSASADITASVADAAVPDLPAAESATIAGELDWQAFWNPFRTEIAAQGFVRQLEKVTGLDYRIVKTGHGVYEVAFAYGTEEERTEHLSQIAAATGLDLGDGSP